ncbi:MAG TPA: hypothetical protein VFQ78_05905 [Candidatus Udaeobacter sp.]|nr:hypothetical protein [Candidatus Udaeobacter sp.]
MAAEVSRERPGKSVKMFLLAMGDSGFTYAPVVTVPDGVFTRTLVTCLNIHLPPGTYWLNVTPAGHDNSGIDFSLAYTTSGVNCVGAPCGNDGNSFSYSPESGETWAQFSADWPMGITGFSCPGNCEIYVSSAESSKILLNGLKLDVPLNLTGESTVEDRSGQPGGNYSVQLTISQNIIRWATPA